VDDENASIKTYTARKNFYTMAQFSKFIRPGAQRIDISGSTYPFWWMLAFYHPGLKDEMRSVNIFTPWENVLI
jgi:O-glycosyl hydrolase